MKRTLLTVVALLALAVPGTAQTTDKAALQQMGTTSGIGVKPAASPVSLLDASRITWSNSYSVSFFSGSGTSGSMGLWQTTMHYALSDNLNLSLNLGVTHNPGALWGNEQTDAGFLPGFQLDWRPSEKVFMSLSVQTYNGYTSPYYHSSRYRHPGSVWFLD
jgi:hypothetical protein